MSLASSPCRGEFEPCGWAVQLLLSKRMMNIGLKALKIAAASWITLAVMAPGLGTMVVCIGSDGHLSLKSAQQGRCLVAADDASHERHVVIERVASVGDDCCRDCLDVSIPPGAIAKPAAQLRGASSVRNALARIPAASWGTVDIHVSAGTPHFFRVLPMELFPSLRAQRTVVLRI